jgi:hypothetical protein
MKNGHNITSAAKTLGALGAKKGGTARMASMTKAARRALAVSAARSRWNCERCMQRKHDGACKK